MRKEKPQTDQRMRGEKKKKKRERKKENKLWESASLKQPRSKDVDDVEGFGCVCCNETRIQKEREKRVRSGTQKKRKEEREERGKRRRRRRTINEGFEWHRILCMQKDADDLLQRLDGGRMNVDIRNLIDGPEDFFSSQLHPSKTPRERKRKKKGKGERRNERSIWFQTKMRSSSVQETDSMSGSMGILGGGGSMSGQMISSCFVDISLP